MCYGNVLCVGKPTLRAVNTSVIGPISCSHALDFWSFENSEQLQPLPQDAIGNLAELRAARILCSRSPVPLGDVVIPPPCGNVVNCRKPRPASLPQNEVF